MAIQILEMAAEETLSKHVKRKVDLVSNITRVFDSTLHKQGTWQFTAAVTLFVNHTIFLNSFIEQPESPKGDLLSNP